MHRVFFNFRDGDCLVPDEEGVTLRNVDDVEREAVAALWQLSKYSLRGNADLAIEAVDAAGNIVLQAELSVKVTRRMIS